MNFFEKVYSQVKQIPSGKVATYGQVATRLGKPRLARMVGSALHVNRSSQVPCHRVVNRNGEIAVNFGLGGWQTQRERLEEEGVVFISQRKVDLKRYQWFRHMF